MNDFASFNKIYETYFVKEFLPLSCIEVGRLSIYATIEVEVIAMYKEKHF